MVGGRGGRGRHCGGGRDGTGRIRRVAHAGARGCSRSRTLYRRRADERCRGRTDGRTRPGRNAPGGGADSDPGQPGLRLPGRPRRELQASDADQPRDHSPAGLRRPCFSDGARLVEPTLRAHLPDPLHPRRNLRAGHRQPHALRHARGAQGLLPLGVHDRRRPAEGLRRPPRPWQPPPPRPRRGARRSP